MLISFDFIKHPLYNSSYRGNKVTYSCVPIKYNRCYYLLTVFENLDGVFSQPVIPVCIYINKNKRIIKELVNVRSIHMDTEDTCCGKDGSFYDSYTSLLFIEFQDISIEYIEMDTYIQSTLLTQQFKNTKVVISWLNNYLEKELIETTIINNYEYDYRNSGFIMPPIPHLICTLNEKKYHIQVVLSILYMIIN